MKVSVVIPVYNTKPYLAECLDSILAQDMPSDEFEIVAVDDGSTDGSGQVLDDYADRHGNVRVIHQENSGWPGRPRNVGIEAAKGTYVFFADSDDCLAPEALRRMYDFAEAHGSDVVVPKLVRTDGAPHYGVKVWRKNEVDADLARMMITIGPWKLFRKDFLDRQGLRFPEAKVRLEDGIFVTEAYVTARRVSSLADYNYYLKRTQPDGGNISSAPVDAVGYTASLATMMASIRRHCADAAVADGLIAMLYRRKGLKWFGPGRFERYSRRRRTAWVEAVAALAEEHVSPSIDELLPFMHRLRSVLVRAREAEALRALAEAQEAGQLLEVAVTAGGLELGVPGLSHRPALPVMPGLRLVAGTPAPLASPAASQPPAVRATARGWTTSEPGRVAVDLARRRVWPVARRSALGRRAWAWTRDRWGSERP